MKKAARLNRLARRQNGWEKTNADRRGTRFERGYRKPGSLKK